MNIIFVCHGNICRSPIAEILFNELVVLHHKEDKFSISSRATSFEEIGNGIYYPMKQVLAKHNVIYKPHTASRITKTEFDAADYIFYMDKNNLYYLIHLFGESKKFHLISEFGDNKEVEDPWYTGRFEYVYQQLKIYCKQIYEKMTE